MTSPLIVARDVEKIYKMGETEVHALNGVTVDIQDGEYVAIMGPSGSGKSTFMNLLGALDAPTRGSMTINGKDLAAQTPEQLAKFRGGTIGFVFQQYHLLPRTPAIENVELPLLYAGVPADARRERAAARLNQVGLGDRMDHLPSQLSGGQQQRVAIARALANDPRIVLADEPTGALDSKTSEEIMDLFENLNAEGMTLIVVTHEADVAARAKRRLTFRDGKLVEDDR